MTVRVAHCGTGATGIEVLRGILNRPDLELVALWTTTPDKVGSDAGELAGRARNGVTAVASLDDALATRPDVFSYCGNGLGREAEAAQQMATILARGVDVATISLLNLLYPPVAPAPLATLLREAALTGGSSFVSTGLDPGFSSDLLPVSLLTLCDEVRHVHVQEIGVYDHYDVESVLRGVMGFGHPPEHEAPIAAGGAFLSYWGGMVHQIAARMGITLDTVVQTNDQALHDTDLQTSVGLMEAGTVVARRMACEGKLDGRTVITAEHITRMTRGVAPDWPTLDGVGESCYRVVIDGHPPLRCDLDLGRDDIAWGSVTGTAMRLVNALPALVAAEPGLHSALDLPLSPSINVMR